ncbi:MAG: cystathionine gamma-synthase family protein [Thermoprotei archaeon]|nr:MAG: cystathionine gamma-synthase family protein [Thermoprotei archaeon]
MGCLYVGLQTDAIHSHGYYDEATGTFIPPIYQVAMFEQIVEPRLSDRGVDLKYSREENPTVRCLERVIARLEEGDDALCFSSGMAAISCVYIGLLRKGDRVVIPMEAYGTTIQLALELKEKFGIEVVTVYPETEEVINAVNRNTKLVLVETITNPMLRVIDVPEVAKVCKEYGVTLVVDNTFATPVLYKPLRDGATLVIHSMTKYIAGHNDVIAGSVIGSRELILHLWDWRRKLGTIIPPFEAYLVLRGVKTLELRVRKHCENAQAVAEFLKEHSRVEEVLYPGLPDNRYHEVAKKLLRGGFGGVVSFKIKGGKEEVRKFFKNLKVIKPAPSLGGPESLITYPVLSAARTIPVEFREKLGITENLVRLSVGLEDVNDIIEDLDRALKAI